MSFLHHWDECFSAHLRTLCKKKSQIINIKELSTFQTFPLEPFFVTYYHSTGGKKMHLSQKEISKIFKKKTWKREAFKGRPHVPFLPHYSLVNTCGISESQEGECVLKICFCSLHAIKGIVFFTLAWAAGVFGCDRQELDMKGTANSKYDLINYICQWFPADLSPALHMLPLRQPTSQPVNQSVRKFSALG